MDRRTFVASSVAIASAGAVSAAEQPSLRSRLLGGWSLIEAVTVNETETVPWFGRHPPIKGNLIYTEIGWMSLHITGGVPGAISRADFLQLPATDRVVWLDAYYAYYGSFEIDEVAHVVTHHVANSLLPYETATTLKRNVAFDGEMLTLLTPPHNDGGGKTFNRLVWKKTP